MALNSRLWTNQILSNNDQMPILFTSYIIVTVQFFKKSAVLEKSYPEKDSIGNVAHSQNIWWVEMMACFSLDIINFIMTRCLVQFRALQDITSSPDVWQIFKIQTIRKPDIFHPEHLKLLKICKKSKKKEKENEIKKVSDFIS